MKNKETRIKKLEKLISLGKTKFVLIYGVIYWGMGVPITMTLLNIVTQDDSMNLRQHLLRFALFLIGGVFMGLFFWSQALKQHKKLTSE